MPFRENHVRGYLPITLTDAEGTDRTWRAISWTTAASAVAVVEPGRRGQSCPRRASCARRTSPWRTCTRPTPVAVSPTTERSPDEHHDRPVRPRPPDPRRARRGRPVRRRWRPGRHLARRRLRVWAG
ncbi:hypothetical protein G5V59_11750 [Nocardioides sp. W3-2-3]|uniref:hypothetical protein n=1 Tax=Nocardioides convexus TaxID=2712224 RepID=UPI0024182F8E|nr:hypothetical protein [Nocardioides convexus]NHA00477.1 hypothetical protein [Nocardioides convexus]